MNFINNIVHFIVDAKPLMLAIFTGGAALNIFRARDLARKGKLTPGFRKYWLARQGFHLTGVIGVVAGIPAIYTTLVWIMVGMSLILIPVCLLMVAYAQLLKAATRQVEQAKANGLQIG